MKFQKIIGTATALAIIGFTFQSCVKNKIDFNNRSDQQWTPEIALPLVNSTFTIKDILVQADKNGNISVGSDNFCTLIYKGNLFSIKGTDLVPLPPQSFNVPTYSLSASDAATINLLPSGSTYSSNINNTINFDPGKPGVKLDEVTYKAGSLNITVNSSIKQDALITVSIPSASKSGIVFSKIISVPASGGNNTNVTQTYDLTGYKFDMTNGGAVTNTFDINYSVVLTKTNNASSAGEEISISQSFADQSFSLIKGDVGQQDSLCPNIDTVAISLFRNVTNQTGDFRIKYGTVKFDINNSYGLPIRISNLQLSPYGDGQSFTYNSILLPAAYNSLDINAPTTIGATANTSPPQIGGPSETTLNTTINQKPKNFIYKVQTTSNPNGSPSAGNRNFLTDNSQFNVDFELDLPLYGGAWDFIFQDTSAFDFGEKTSEQINNLTFRVYVKNGFPFDVNLNIDFADSLYRVVQSLDPRQYADVIVSASVANEKVVAPTEKTTDFTLTKPMINNLRTVKYIIVRALGNTTNGQSSDIKIYADYTMQVKMGIKGELNIPIGSKK